MASRTAQSADIISNGLDNLQVQDSEIVKTFSKATVLITGGTGYLGQLLIEKLLRTCPDLRKIYLLARPKKGKDMHERLEKQFKGVIYDQVRAINPDFVRKVEPIAGDCGEMGLGICNDDRITIIEEVNVIFHSAATVRFNEPLKLAVAINTRGTREMLLLARACKNLKALLHISTAFSNCHLPDIEEKFYEVNLSGDKLIDLAESMDKETLDKITPGLTTGHPNTYTYTKKAAEDIIQRYGQDLPIAIVRPSIVTGTRKEPLPGWSGNLYGMAGAMIGGGVGLMHTAHISTDKVADGVPGDMVSNACIAAAAKIARQFQKNVAVEPSIYMCGTSPLTPITWGEYIEGAAVVYTEYPSMKAIYFYFCFCTANYWLFKVLSFLLHWIPAYLVDGVAILAGKKPVMKMVYTKVENLMASLDFFMNNEWTFSNKNTLALYNDMSKADKELFDFNFAALDWDEYIRDYVIGSRVYIMKDPLDTVEQAKRKNKFLAVLHYFVCGFLIVLTYGLFRGVSALLSYF